MDGDTIISPGSKEATFDAVGSIITAIDGEQNKEFQNAFCAVRPPGHHAEKNKAMGFCIYNNVAVGANYLLEKYKFNKIAIIDFDVHHGNGTQDIFYDNEKVLYISTHQYPYYPGTGGNNEKGKYNNNRISKSAFVNLSRITFFKAYCFKAYLPLMRSITI